MSTGPSSEKLSLSAALRLVALRVAALCSVLALVSCGSTPETLIWDWSCSQPEQGAGEVGSVKGAPEVLASGTLVTEKTPDAEGYYQIISIAGNRQGIAIKSLHSAGTAIPDNEPYKVDNRIRPSNSGGQLTKAGIGYGLADGSYENLFYASFMSPPVYMVFRSKPPFGMTPPNTEEPTVIFKATIR